MQVLDAEQDLGEIELCLALGEAAAAVQVEEELSAGAEVEHEVQVVSRLKRPVHLDDERVSHQLEDGAFVHDLLHLADLLHLRLAQRLQCVELAGVLLAH